MIRYGRRPIALAVALSALAGYVDATGFLATRGFFVSFMSGNSTRLGIGLGQGRFGYAAEAAGVILSFVTGVVVGTLVGSRAGEYRKSAVLFLVALFLLLASIAWTVGIPHLGTPALLMAMGAENAVFQRDGEVSIGVTYMTGTLVKLGQRVAAALQGGSKRACLPYALLWLGLMTGAVGGTAMFSHYGSRGLWLAVPVTLLLAVAALRIKPQFSRLMPKAT